MLEQTASKNATDNPLLQSVKKLDSPQHIEHLSSSTCKLFYIPINLSGCNTNALVDTGAFSSAMPRETMNKIKSRNPRWIRILPKGELTSVKLADGASKPIIAKVLVKLMFMGKRVEEEFLVLEQMNSVILGLPFFAKNKIVIDPANRKLQFEDNTFLVNEMQGYNGQIKTVPTKRRFRLVTAQRITVQPQAQEPILVEIHRNDRENHLKNTSGVIEPIAHLEDKLNIAITSSLSKLDKKFSTQILILNVNPNVREIPKGTNIGTYYLMSPKQARYIMPIDPQVLAHIGEDMPLERMILNRNRKPPRKPSDYTIGFDSSQYWFPTPENCQDPSNLSEINRRIYKTLTEFQAKEKVDPNRNLQDRRTFLSNFEWTESMTNTEEQKKIEDLLVEFQDIFARHPLDTGTNTSFKVKLTPEHHDPVYTQPPPTPIHMRDDILVELAVMQYYGIIKPLAFSKYASPLFAQRKPNGQLRLLIDLRRINHLIRHDYNNNNFPLATIADAGHHLAGKKYFCKLDCSQAYFCLQMADELSTQLLAFNFAGRTFAFQRLAQGLSRSVSAFSSFMRAHLDPVIAANLCFQYVDDICSAANSIEELIRNLRAVFEAIRSAGLKLTMNKCQFAVPSIKFLGNTITSQGISPNEEKVSKFLNTIVLATTEKGIKSFLGFLQFFRAFIPNLSEKVVGFYKLLQKNVAIELTNEHRRNFKTLKQDLLNACKMSLRLPLPDMQYVILADASFYAAGFVLMIEDYIEDEKGTTKVRYAPVSFGSKVFTPSQIKMSIYAKELYITRSTLLLIISGELRRNRS